MRRTLSATALTAIKNMVNFAFDTRNSIDLRPRRFSTRVCASMAQDMLHFVFKLRQRPSVSPITCRPWLWRRPVRYDRPPHRPLWPPCLDLRRTDAKADIHRHRRRRAALGQRRLTRRSILHAVVNDISIIDSTNIVTDEPRQTNLHHAVGGTLRRWRPPGISARRCRGNPAWHGLDNGGSARKQRERRAGRAVLSTSWIDPANPADYFTARNRLHASSETAAAWSPAIDDYRRFADMLLGKGELARCPHCSAARRSNT